jgi:plasmid stability protein
MQIACSPFVTPSTLAPFDSMANLTVKDLPDTLYAKLKAQARAHRRSIAAETTVILERALGERPIPEAELLQRARRLRERTSAYLTEEDRKEAVRRGRA